MRYIHIVGHTNVCKVMSLEEVVEEDLAIYQGEISYGKLNSLRVNMPNHTIKHKLLEIQGRTNTYLENKLSQGKRNSSGVSRRALILYSNLVQNGVFCAQFGRRVKTLVSLTF